MMMAGPPAAAQPAAAGYGQPMGGGFGAPGMLQPMQQPGMPMQQYGAPQPGGYYPQQQVPQQWSVAPPPAGAPQPAADEGNPFA